MDSNNEHINEPKEFVEPPIEESTRVQMHGCYANGPDYYVQSLRQHPVGAPAPNEVEETEPKPKPEGPVCPQCGNAINEAMQFCPECGSPLR